MSDWEDIQPDEWEDVSAPTAAKPIQQPPEEQSFGSQLWGGIKEAAGTAADYTIGQLKGAGNTAMGAIGVMDQALSGDALLGPSAQDQATGALQKLTGNQDILKPTNTAQETGFGAEQIGEYLLPVGETKFGLKGSMGLNALRDSSVYSAQQGKVDSGSGIVAGISGGMTGIAGKVGMYLEKAKAASAAKVSKLTSAADEFGVPLKSSQRTGSVFQQSVESMVQRFGVAADIFKTQAEKVSAKLKSGAAGIADRISPDGLSGANLGEYIKKELGTVQDLATNELHGVYEQIAKEAPDAMIPLKGISSVAGDMLTELKSKVQGYESLKQSDSVKMAMGILQDFATTTTSKATGAVDEMGQAIFADVPKMVPASQGIALRTLLYDLTRKGEIDIGKGALAQVTGAIHDGVVSGLEQAGRKDLATAFTASSTAYRETMEKLEISGIKSILKGDAPEKALDILMRSPETYAGKLRETIGPVKMEVVERAFWERIFDSSVKDGVPGGAALKQAVEKLGKDNLSQMIPNPQRLKEIENFVRLSDELQKTTALAKPGGSNASPYATSLVAGSMVGLGTSVLSGDPKRGLQAGALAASFVLAPRMIAKAMTREGGAVAMTRLIRMSPESQEYRHLAGLIMRSVGYSAAASRSEPISGLKESAY